ncbi:thioredoxin family protein [Hydrogenimonas urashimensis]|uniref:thioredoxin family protein n=1 Tax=Hydrogenimonas urashimensis TaxID=2740515 RepID=UPI001916A0F6|nr:thioredoxin family protein [Hydrogenimonas urashimensis]
MKIEILGTGCAKCKTLEQNVMAALGKVGKFAELKKVEDITEIMQYGVMTTPGLVIDGQVVSVGKVLSPDEIAQLIQKAG